MEVLRSGKDDVLARLRAVSELAKIGTPSSIQALVDAMASERTATRTAPLRAAPRCAVTMTRPRPPPPCRRRCALACQHSMACVSAPQRRCGMQARRPPCALWPSCLTKSTTRRLSSLSVRRARTFSDAPLLECSCGGVAQRGCTANVCARQWRHARFASLSCATRCCASLRGPTFRTEQRRPRGTRSASTAVRAGGDAAPAEACRGQWGGGRVWCKGLFARTWLTLRRDGSGGSGSAAAGHAGGWPAGNRPGRRRSPVGRRSRSPACGPARPRPRGRVAGPGRAHRTGR